MKVDWPDDRCIICFGRPQQGKPMTERTEAHVIPESLGGKLWAPFLCKQCNSDMGRLEGVLPKDVMILDLVDRLHGVLPSDLANSVYRHAGYFADSEEFGRIYGGLDEKLTLTPQESETIRGERNTLRQIEAALRWDGADDATIKEKLSGFAKAVDGERVDVVPGLAVVKGVPLDALEWKRTYDVPIVSRAVPLGIGYLYLALCIGGHVYGTVLEPTREQLRRAMAGDETLGKEWPFKPMRSKKPPEPRHALAATQEEEGVLVRIFFFRELVWPVRFPDVVLRGVEPFYLIDLVNGDEVLE